MRCTTCDALALADDDQLETLVRRQVAQIERLGDRLVSAAVELSTTREELSIALETVARQNRRLTELTRQLDRVAS